MPTSQSDAGNSSVDDPSSQVFLGLCHVDKKQHKHKPQLSASGYPAGNFGDLDYLSDRLLPKPLPSPLCSNLTPSGEQFEHFLKRTFNVYSGKISGPG